MKLTPCCLAALITLSSASRAYVSPAKAQDMVNTQQHVTEVVFDAIIHEWRRNPEVADCLKEGNVERSLFEQIKQLGEAKSLWFHPITQREIKGVTSLPQFLIQPAYVAQSVETLIHTFHGLVNTPACPDVPKMRELRFISEIMVFWNDDMMDTLLKGSRTVVLPTDVDAFVYRAVRLNIKTVLFIIAAREDDHNSLKGRHAKFDRIMDALRYLYVSTKNVSQTTLHERVEFLELARSQSAAVMAAFSDLVQGFNPAADELESFNHIIGFRDRWIKEATDLGTMVSDLRRQITKATTTSTTTTESPMTLSIDELAALIESSGKPKKKQAKKKKESIKVSPVISVKTETIPTTISTSAPTTTATPDAAIDESEWTMVEKQVKRPTKPATKFLVSRPRAATTTTTEAIPIEFEQVSSSTTRTTTTIPTTTTTITTTTTTTTTMSKTTSTTTTVTTNIPTTSTESSTSTEETTTTEGFTMADSSVAAAERSTNENNQMPRGWKPVGQSAQQAYLMIPLAKPSVDQMWVLTTQMAQLSAQLGQLSNLALQQGNGPAVRENIAFFARKAAYAHQVLTDLQMSASGLVQFINTAPAAVFVPPPQPV